METDLNNMTMRDLFAAFALAGMLADNSERFNLYVLSASAYRFADAMIDQRTIGRSSDATGL
jgi:hypothetical protein